MADTQQLLNQIVALRKRLEQTRTLTRDAVFDPPVGQEVNVPVRLEGLGEQVSAGATESAVLDSSLRQLTEPVGLVGNDVVWPERLTSRGRRILERGRDLVNRLRGLDGEPLLKRDASDPLDARFRGAVAMTDTALRMIQAFPDAPGAQLRLCEGLDVILDVVAARIASLVAILDQRRRESAWVENLAQLLTALEAGQLLDVKAFAALAEELLAEARQGGPLRFLHHSPAQPARFVACHSIMVSQVVGRVLRHDPELRRRPMDAVLAALVHDVGMLRVPVDILTQPGPLSDEQRRVVESHARTGAELLGRLGSGAGALAQAAAGHHERLDGTGYPAGLRDAQISPMNRLLAVCDVYAALCAPRPHRPAYETRTALTDTLLLADQGALDRNHAESLLVFSFYPAGSVVELADGAVGVVVATPMGRRDLDSPARPVVTLLTDPQGQPLPAPQYLDLTQVEGRSIVRSLSPAERRELLSKTYPEAA